MQTIIFLQIVKNVLTSKYLKTAGFDSNGNLIKQYLFQIKIKYYIGARFVSIYNDDNQLIVSTYHPNLKNNYGRTYIINLVSKQIKQLIIKNSEDYPYKAVIDPLTNDMYYTICKSKIFEDRQLETTTKWQVIDVVNLSNIFTFV